MAKVPKRFQGMLWSINVDKLDTEKNITYIIPQILAYGSWNDYLWLFKTYGREEVKRVFVTYPGKEYHNREAFNFIKRNILEINEEMDERFYSREYPRIMEPYKPPKLKSRRRNRKEK